MYTPKSLHVSSETVIEFHTAADVSAAITAAALIVTAVDAVTIGKITNPTYTTAALEKKQKQNKKNVLQLYV